MQVSKSLNRCQAMQIIRPGIPDKDLVFQYDKTLRKVVKTKQSNCVKMYESCAIVGNSGILLGSECGDVIDSADLIIRNNAARIDGSYRVDVGTRMDVMTMNLELIHCLANCLGLPKKKMSVNCTKTLSCKELRDRMKIFKTGNIFWFFKRYKDFKEMKSVLAALRNTYKLNFTLAYSPVIPMDAAGR